MIATESIDPMMAAVSALMVGGHCRRVMIVLDRLYGLDKVLVGSALTMALLQRIATHGAREPIAFELDGRRPCLQGLRKATPCSPRS